MQNTKKYKNTYKRKAQETECNFEAKHQGISPTFSKLHQYNIRLVRVVHSRSAARGIKTSHGVHMYTAFPVPKEDPGTHHAESQRSVW